MNKHKRFSKKYCWYCVYVGYWTYHKCTIYKNTKLLVNEIGWFKSEEDAKLECEKLNNENS